MSAASKSMVVFGTYLFVLGAILVVAPNAILVPFGSPPTSEVWIRIVGMLTFFLGYYYFRAGRQGLVAFFRFTVHARLMVPIFFVAFVALRFAPPTLILFGLVDLAGATWTLLALRVESPRASRLAARP